MSYTDHAGRSRPAVAAVILVHAVIGYGLYSGLAIRILPHGPDILRAYDVPETPPPPPRVMPPIATPQTRTPLAADPIIRVPLSDPMPLAPPILPQIAAAGPHGIEVGTVAAPPTPQVEQPDLARMPVAIGSRAAWVTEADYPPAALREGREGTTGIAVMVGADGRVTACEVTASSGDARLDEATCRIYARRARFQPGLDERGQPTIARRTDRVRWQVPRE